jgi:predicted Na+-dependent transporter
LENAFTGICIYVLYFPALVYWLNLFFYLYWAAALLGLLFMCFLPSTVQSSIAFTSVAKGNVQGRYVVHLFSNLVGMFITPVLVSFLF